MVNLKPFIIFLLILCAFVMNTLAQETPPAPGAPKSGSVPAVREKKLGNGLTIAVVERKGVPLVTIQLLVKAGASAEDGSKAGLADLTASMLTKGTKTKTATQIAEEIEFLGGSINSGAGWNSSFVSVTVTSDKVDQAMAILADVVLNPKFDQKELDLLKSQTLDGLTYNLKQPSFLANYVASKYSFNEHPAGGTDTSIGAISRSDVAAFHKANYLAKNSVLIFTGDVSKSQAVGDASRLFGLWKKIKETPFTIVGTVGGNGSSEKASEKLTSFAKRILVVDFPKSGQAAVNYAKKTPFGRVDGCNVVTYMCEPSDSYYTASVLNSVLGGGYSSRLNYEIRIKRGLSYGAGSSFAWRIGPSNFSTRTQTKNESAAEVGELVIAELTRLIQDSIPESELIPRKSVLTGGFGRSLETTTGLANAIGDLFSFSIPAEEINSYVSKTNSVKDMSIRNFGWMNLEGGDIIIVGDYSIFKDDLAKRFPNMKIDVIEAADLDLSKDNLRK